MRGHKFVVAGCEVFRTPAHIEVVHTAPTGLTWADAVLAELVHRAAASHRPVHLQRWLVGRHRDAFAVHLRSLIEHGALHHRPTGFLRRDRHYPDPALHAALAQAAVAANNRQVLDGHMLLLCDLLDATELGKDLGCRLSWSQRLDRGRGVGTVEALPEELRETSALLGMAVSSRHDGD